MEIKIVPKRDISKYKRRIVELTKPLEDVYPDYNNWLDKSLNEVDDTRTLILVFNRKKVIGVSLLKHDSEERKICSIMIHPSYTGRKYGTKLMDLSLTILRSKNSLGDIFITIDSGKYNIFNKLFNKYNAKFIKKVDDLYKAGRTELFFKFN